MNTATRQKIVMTALELFYVKGYNSTSISTFSAAARSIRAVCTISSLASRIC